ncbi:hypothetical protein HK101_001949, partial [Irineochytrium annulatum]
MSWRLWFRSCQAAGQVAPSPFDESDVNSTSAPNSAASSNYARPPFQFSFADLAAFSAPPAPKPLDISEEEDEYEEDLNSEEDDESEYDDDEESDFEVDEAYRDHYDVPEDMSRYQPLIRTLHPL